MTAGSSPPPRRGLATLRIKAFRHVHDLPVLTQNTERRGALVSRVTSDVDQVSQFLVFGGLLFVVSVGQMLRRHGRHAVLQLAARPSSSGSASRRCSCRLRYFQRRLSDGLRHRPPAGRRHAVGDLRAGRRRRGGPLATPSRTAPRRASTRRSTTHQAASTRAQGFTAFSFSLGGISAGLANAGVLIVGIWLGFAGDDHRRQGPRLRVPGARCSSARCRWAPRSSPTPRTPSPAGAG